MTHEAPKSGVLYRPDASRGIEHPTAMDVYEKLFFFH